MLVVHSIENADDLSLQLDSTLEKLPLWEILVEISLPGQELMNRFETDPLLPGVILTDNQQFVGMISRQRFFELMSRPYSYGLFARRAIESLYNFLQQDLFTLSEDTLIVDATQIGLKRSPKFAYEPILVKKKCDQYGILDFHDLLLANSHIHSLTLAKLQHVEQQSQIAKAGFRDLQNNYTRLLQNEKMAALGQLVAGIAHEVNNPVNFIAGNITHILNYSNELLSLIDLYQKYYPHPVEAIEIATAESDLDFITKDLPDVINSLKNGCDRIRQIVHSLRNFSRLDESDRKNVDIHEGIDSTLILLKSRIKDPANKFYIDVIREYGNLPLIDCYPGLLNQVFMNLIVNAIDVLEECIANNQNNPEIHISTDIIEEEVVIRIADNGTGIPEDVKQKLFDPFFTTKPVGKGTGLGLSICYQIIVEKHRGQIECLSTVGKGTEFVIKIPSKFKVEN